MKDLNLMVTLWPSFPHFPRFANDKRLSGIRLNSAMMENPELEDELGLIQSAGKALLPMYFDVKGRQLRVAEVHDNPDHLDITLNHPIQVATPTIVLFKAGEDSALLLEVADGGRRLIFDGGPQWVVKKGESLHIRDKSLRVFGQQFIQTELEKIEKVKKAGFKKFFLSYVQNQKDIDQFRELVGRDAEIKLKIEDRKGLEYVAREFRKEDGVSLVAARGDMYVEIDKPHDILAALKLIIRKDPEACAASRILLSVVSEAFKIRKDLKFIISNFLNQNLELQTAPDAIGGDAEIQNALNVLMGKNLNDIIDSMIPLQEGGEVPSCADFSELAWLYDIGYRDMMLCDELCLKGDLLATAVNAFDSFRDAYAGRIKTVPIAPKKKLFFDTFKERMSRIHLGA